MMWARARVLNPLSERALRLASGDVLPEARRVALDIVEGRLREGATARVQAQALHLVMRAAKLAGEPGIRAAEDVLRRYLDAALQETLRELGWGRSSFDSSLIEGVLEGFELLPLTKAGVDTGEARKIARVTGEVPEFAVHWRQLMPAVRRGRLRLTSMFLRGGYAVLSLKQALECYTEFVLEGCAGFMRAQEAEEGEELEEIAERLRSISERHAVQRVEGRALKPELFPPCIRATLEGVGSGLRNYAITVLLTSFISYARIAPRNANRNARIADFVDDIRVVTEEILPVIYEAAERCSPPLFQDQPAERMNINYHLGFGLTSEPRLEDSGRSPWYFVPNCEKVRREAPSLCRMDRECREVKNPLSYYFRKRYAKREGEQGVR